MRVQAALGALLALLVGSLAACSPRDRGGAEAGVDLGAPAELMDAAAPDRAPPEATPTEDARPEEAPEAGPPPEVTPPPPPVPAGDYESTAATCIPAAPTFIDAVAGDAWQVVDLAPAAGMQGVAQALLAARTTNAPVRVRLQAGFYAPADQEPVLDVVGLSRPRTAPLLIEAVDKTPGATQLGQGLRFVGGSYFGLDGVSIGPPAVGTFHGSDFCQPGSCYHDAPKPFDGPAALEITGTAIAPERPGESAGRLDHGVYGQYLPAHHVSIRRVTIQNVFGDDEPSGAGAAAADADGIVLRHAADVWVLQSRIRQVARTGIDAIGVHGACLRGNFIAETGGGAGVATRGGSIDVTVDGNVLYDVRRLELGGAHTDAVLHWSVETAGSTLHLGYEARRLVARNNLLVDARQGALVFSGCRECAAVGNTVLYRAGFPLGDGGGDAVREADSAINSSDASAACTGVDGAVVESCWGVGPFPVELVPKADPDGAGVSRTLINAGNTLANNLFASGDGFWGPAFNPYRRDEPTDNQGLLQIDHNYWWNGGAPLTDPGDDTWLKEGPHSIYASNAPATTVGIAVVFAVAGDPAVALTALRPTLTSPLVGKASSVVVGYAPHDAIGTVRGSAPAIGALEP
jgi:hypothetical protein